MIDRLKILDCNRKALLTLPDPAVHLWLTYYMNEDEERESYMSIDAIQLQMNMTMKRRSIITWTQWLVANGWLVEVPGKTAADKFIERGKQPTRGAKQIRVYRVDDPTSAKSAQVNSTAELENQPSSVVSCTSAKSAPVHPGAHKVYCSGSGYDSRSSSDSPTTPVRAKGGAVRVGQKTDENPNPKPEPTPKAQPAKVKVAGDGTPWPKGFDSWTNVRRTNWLQLHNGSEASRKEQADSDKQLELAERAGRVILATAASASQTAPIDQATAKPKGNGWYETIDFDAL